MRRFLHRVLRWLFLATAWLTSPAQAEDVLVVLELGGDSFEVEVRQIWTDVLRGEAAKRLPGHRVYTRESIEVYLTQMGLTLEDCASGSCEVDIGRKMGASLVMTGKVSKIEGERVASIKLHETAHGSLLGARRARGKSSRELEADLERRSAELFSLVAGAPSPASTTPGAGTPIGGGSDNWDLNFSSGHAVRFESDPPGAEVRVDGRYLGVTPRGAELSEGGHTVVLKLSRYAPHEESISVSGPLTVSGTLTPLFGWISVTTDPSGLAVTLDGASIGTAPIRRHEASPGAHTLLVRDPRYHDAGQQGFGLSGNQALEFHFTPEPRLGGLKVTAEESGESGSALALPVTIDGEAVGTTPWAEKVLVGRHEVKVGGEARRVEVAEHQVTSELFEVISALIEAAPSRRDSASAAATNSIGMQMVRILAGSFMMGSPGSESGRDDDETQHRVTLTRDFFLASTEVTQGQWESVMGSNPSDFKGRDRPVENVS